MSALQIAHAWLHEIALPLKEPFRISGGSMAVRRSWIVELEDREGNRGWGESAPFETPFYSDETMASARYIIEHLLLPRVLGEPVETAKEIFRSG